MTKINVRIGEIPSLILFKDGIKKAADNGTIIFYHGLISKKEAGLKELESLMNEGYLVIAVDNIGHGERKYYDFDDRFSSKVDNFEEELIDAVTSTAGEVSQIIDYVLATLAPKAKKFAVCGISMGGHIAFRSILNDRRISVAVPILGSPQWRIKRDSSPHLYVDEFYPCRILSINGGADKAVPPEDTRKFHRKLEKVYKKRKSTDNVNTQEEINQMVKYIEIPDAPHMMEDEDWNYLWSEVLGWFRLCLS